MENANRPKEDSPSLWEYIPVNDFRRPPATVTETVKKGVSGFWRRLWPTVATDNPEAPQKQLELLSPQALTRLVSTPNWQPSAVALAHCLMPWLKQKTAERKTLTVTGPPHSGNAEILECFAANQKWRVITAPAAEQIVTGDCSWLTQLLDDQSSWVLPRLEKCYLRHVHGLKLVRELFMALQDGRISPGIIGCDSWARAYLQHAVPGLLRHTHVAQAFDHERLGRWLQALATAAEGNSPIFRQQDNGTRLLPVTTDSESDSGLFLRHLAAYSRGNPGVARALWRCALRNLPQNKKLKSTDGKAEPQPLPPVSDIASRPENRPRQTVWVLPWKGLQHPAAEITLKDKQYLVLHALLLHNGLSTDVLSWLLPFSGIAAIEAIMRLEQAELIELTQGIWQVSAAGYPEARRLINDAGYLTDDF